MITLNKTTLAEIDKLRTGGWTQDRIACALEAKKSGLSAQQIADRIESRFGVIYSRNAVTHMLGRVRREKNKPRKPVQNTGPKPIAPPAGHPLHGLPLLVIRKKTEAKK